MTKIDEIETAIAGLPQEQFEQLAQWFDRQRETAFDRQIEADAKAGRLDGLWTEAGQEIAQGKVRPLDELLDN